MNNQQSVPIEQLVARYFVKYKRLNQIIPVAYEGSKATFINLYIDLYGLYKTIFSRSYRTSTTDYTSFTSSVINMCVHYRAYFKGIGVYCKIFLISSYNIPEINGKFVAGYNKTFFDKLKNTSVKELMELNFQLLELICPYLQGIYFLNTSFESTVLIDHLIKSEMEKGNKNPNMIISSDLYPMQLCAKYPQTTFLKPKKSSNMDNSEIVCPIESPLHHRSFWGIICYNRDLMDNSVNSIRISTKNFILLEALNRFPERNIKLLLNVTESERIIYNAIQDQDLKLSINTLYEISTEIQSKVPISIIDSRYKVLDVDYQSYLFDESVESKTIVLNDLNDPEAIRLINDQYFSNNPIDIFRLR